MASLTRALQIASAADTLTARTYTAKSSRSPPDGRLLRPTLYTTLYAIFLLHIVILTFVYLGSLRRPA